MRLLVLYDVHTIGESGRGPAPVFFFWSAKPFPVSLYLILSFNLIAAPLSLLHFFWLYRIVVPVIFLSGLSCAAFIRFLA